MEIEPNPNRTRTRILDRTEPNYRTHKQIWHRELKPNRTYVNEEPKPNRTLLPGF